MEVFNCEFVIRDWTDYAGGTSACISGKCNGSLIDIIKKIYEVDEFLGEELAENFVVVLEDAGIEDVEVNDDFSKNLKTLDKYTDYIDNKTFIDELRGFMEYQDTSDSGPIICRAEINGEVIDIDYDVDDHEYYNDDGDREDRKIIRDLKINKPKGWRLY